jgi:hypothetical protein
MIFALFSCTIVPEISEEEKLAEASTKVIFASVEPLGPHQYDARIRRKEIREEIEVSSHDEFVHIDWQDWDNFQYNRTIDTKEVTALIVSNHIPWLKYQSKKWKKQIDAEPYRLQMRTAWNTWEQYLGSYEDRLLWTPLGNDTIEGRTVTRYELSLDTSKNTPNRNLNLQSISGSVSVDQATAVRLYAELTIVLVADTYKKKIDMQLKRTMIGVAQEIISPEKKE